MVTSRPRASAALTVLFVLLFIASAVIVALQSPEGIRLSADPGSPTTPLWAALLPAVAGTALALVLPPRRRPQPVVVDRRRDFGITTSVILVIAVAFTLLGWLLPLSQEDLILMKFVMLIVIPAIVIGLWRRAVRIDRRGGAWRWWAPAIVIAAWMVLSEFMPWVQPFDAGAYDLQTLIIGAVATAITASIGEELFYRRWLQTRLEAIAGPWLGMAIASLLFALMHLTTHVGGSSNLLLDVAQMIVFQGSLGVMLGIMWMRYRNLAAIILVHLIANGWGIVAALLWPGGE